MYWRSMSRRRCNAGAGCATPEPPRHGMFLLPSGMRTLPILATSLLAALLVGCSPHFNWREFTSKDASWQATFPDKPATVSRDIDLDGTKTTMTMTAAEVGDILFAVGQANVGDAAAANAGLAAMQTALVRNIGGSVTHSANASASNNTGTRITRDVDATGSRNGQPIRMQAHFEARGRTLYQVVVVGPVKALKPELTEQFIGSFKALK
jgi:hypothetical protein